MPLSKNVPAGTIRGDRLWCSRNRPRVTRSLGPRVRPSKRPSRTAHGARRLVPAAGATLHRQHLVTGDFEFVEIAFDFEEQMSGGQGRPDRSRGEQAEPKSISRPFPQIEAATDLMSFVHI